MEPRFFFSVHYYFSCSKLFIIYPTDVLHRFPPLAYVEGVARLPNVQTDCGAPGAVTLHLSHLSGARLLNVR